MSRAGLAGAFRAILIVSGVTALLFVAVNVVALLWMRYQAPPTQPTSIFNSVVAPTSLAGIEILKRVHKADTARKALERLSASPSFEMHPSLHYMTARIENQHYKLGLEGIRYDKGWTDAQVRTALGSQASVIFLMGGSTMLGYGVSSDETISWYMNNSVAPRPAMTALNFGSQAYDQQREIEKLNYLLRAGYRPKAVVFLDGMNDVIGVNTSNMRWQDKVIFHGFSSNRGQVAFTPGTESVDYSYLLAISIPVMRWMNAKRAAGFDGRGVLHGRDPFLSGFSFPEAAWVWTNWEQYAAANRVALKDQLVQQMRANAAYLEKLAEAFGFKLVLLYQPIPLFDSRNPFVPAQARDLPSYRWLKELHEHAREEIAAAPFGIHDASHSLDRLQGDLYVDATHYAPAANRALADVIVGSLNR